MVLKERKSKEQRLLGITRIYFGRKGIEVVEKQTGKLSINVDLHCPRQKCKQTQADAGLRKDCATRHALAVN
jgi:hypothetical protein